jgi:hypothetical protein
MVADTATTTQSQNVLTDTDQAPILARRLLKANIEVTIFTTNHMCSANFQYAVFLSTIALHTNGCAFYLPELTWKHITENKHWGTGVPLTKKPIAKKIRTFQAKKKFTIEGPNVGLRKKKHTRRKERLKAEVIQALTSLHIDE